MYILHIIDIIQIINILDIINILEVYFKCILTSISVVLIVFFFFEFKWFYIIKLCINLYLSKVLILMNIIHI